jgi:cytoskeleton protein RodZ
VALFLSARAGLFARHAAEPEPAPAPAVTPDVTQPEDRVYPPPAPSTAAAAPGTPITGALVLTLTAHQDCWVEVRVDGTTALSRTLVQGETQTLQAQSQIVLSVGNAGGIAFTINDRPGLPLGREGEVKRNIVITKESVPALLQDAAAAPAAAPGAGAGAFLPACATAPPVTVRRPRPPSAAGASPVPSAAASPTPPPR